ncbi:MAG: DNA polymerase I [Solirubrobacteraceae bacterium]|nr:DNA polymerase I [Solirubrobacteraceae bacterium]
MRLIDGSSLVYRAFFALPESIATSTGEPTNAIFGFCSMLIKLIDEHGDEPTVVVWDRGHSGRKDIHTEYKANRTSRPDLLKEQWAHIPEMVEALGYKNFDVEGYEADDVIASLAELTRAAGIKTTIVTGDRDSFQLVDDDLVTVLATGRGITDTKRYTAADVVERYGVGPDLIPDLWGLKGDTSDNIPGVPGIGDKTASSLLQQFGSLENVLASIDEVSGAKRKENLTNHAEDARISKQLATMHRDIPVGIDPNDLLVIGDRSRAREILRRWELRDPLRRLEEHLDDTPEEAAQATATVHVEAQLEDGGLELIAGLPADEPVAIVVVVPEIATGELLAVETEVQFAVCSGTTAITGTCESPEQVVELLGDRPVVAHDAKALGRVPSNLHHDTLIGAYLLDVARRAYPLAELLEESGIAADTGEPLADDAARLLALAGVQREKIEARGQIELFDDIELPLVAVLRALELRGIRLDVPALGEITTKVDTELRQLEEDIYTLAGHSFTIGSPQQLGAVLFEELGLSRKRRGKTGFSTDARVLQQIRDEHEIVPRIERWRELNQLKKTYLDTLPHLVDANSRLHTTFEQAIAATGRLSSTNPNLQNVPVRTALGREIRGCFVAPEGRVLLSADYSQIELRLLAYLADETALQEIFRTDQDVHTATASKVFSLPPDQLDAGHRSKAKMVNYGIVYGLSSYGLAERLNIDRDEAQGIIDAYLEQFAGIRGFIDASIEQAKEHGYVETIWHRRRQIPEIRARNFQMRQLGERLATNTPIQGTASDVLKIAMLRVERALAPYGERAMLVLTVHDELVVECEESLADEISPLVVEAMVGLWEHEPPLEVDVGVGRTWLEAK